MATLHGFTATCRCGVVFTTYAPSTLTRFGKESDYRDDFGPEDPSPYFIHTCPRCSFTAPREMFSRFQEAFALEPGSSPAQAPARNAHVVAGHSFEWPIVELLHGPHAETACRWLLVAHTYGKDGLDVAAIASALLHASYHARLAGERAFESAAQREARALFMKRMRDDDADDDERAGISYLIGELSRRLGDYHEAVRWLDAAAALAEAPDYVAAMRKLAARGESAPVTLEGKPVDLRVQVHHQLDDLAARLPDFVLDLEAVRAAAPPSEDAVTIGFDEATRVNTPPRTHGARLFANSEWRVHEVIGGYEMLEPRTTEDWPPAWRVARCRGPAGWQLVEWCDFGYEREHNAADDTWGLAAVAAHLERRLAPQGTASSVRVPREMGVVDPTALFDPDYSGQFVPHDVSDTQSLVYLVDDYVAGVSLAQLLAGPPLAPELAQLVAAALPPGAAQRDATSVDVVVAWDGSVHTREVFRFEPSGDFEPRHGHLGQRARIESDDLLALSARVVALASQPVGGGAREPLRAPLSDDARAQLEVRMQRHLVQHFSGARDDEERWMAAALSVPAGKLASRRTSPISPFINAAVVIDVDGVEMVRIPPTGPHPRGSARALLVDRCVSDARGLSPDDAVAWAAQRGKRLPTEDELDRYARGPVGSIYEWGDRAPDRTAPDARTFGVNAWGVRDLGRPSWEMTTTPAPNRKDGVVVRGGRFRDAPGEPHRLTNRSYEDRGAPDISFRCVRDIDD